MSKIKGWINDPTLLRKFNGWATVFWAINFPIVIAIYWFLPDVFKIASILYLALVSVYANFVGHISSWQASRVEERQQKENEEVEERQQRTIDEIVEKVDEVTPDR